MKMITNFNTTIIRSPLHEKQHFNIFSGQNKDFDKNKTENSTIGLYTVLTFLCGLGVGISIGSVENSNYFLKQLNNLFFE
jgi:hypothetical protein